MNKSLATGILIASVAILSGCSQTPENKSRETQAKTAETKQNANQQSSTSSNNSSDNTSMETNELIIETIAQGQGDQTVKEGDMISVQYTGMLENGKKFDSSYDRGSAPFTFQVGAGQVIKGWDEGLLGAKVGEKRKLTIPSDMGYGDQGYPGVIPPKATLIFEVVVEAIK